MFPPWFSHVFFVESLFYDFGDWRCLCIPMKGPVEWSVWSVAVSEARSNGVIEQELYHHDERHLENSCNLSTKSQKNGATYETFTVRITLANIAMTSELRNKFHRYFSDPKKHIQNMGSFWDSNSSGIQRGYNPESQTLPWSNFYRDSKGPPQSWCSNFEQKPPVEDSPPKFEWIARWLPPKRIGVAQQKRLEPISGI